LVLSVANSSLDQAVNSLDKSFNSTVLLSIYVTEVTDDSIDYAFIENLKMRCFSTAYWILESTQ
jgi:hypothetical protein